MKGLLDWNTKLSIFSLMLIISTILFSYSVYSVPGGPNIVWVSNTTFVSPSANRSFDVKGSITTVTMSLTQQDYKWKAYVGNVSGGLALDNANGKSIYDWTLGTITGEVYATRYSGSIIWINVSCVNTTIVDAEQVALGMSSSSSDDINRTFNYTAHKSFLVGTKNITDSSCPSTATYINGGRQTINNAAPFQEILLRDEVNSVLIYSAMIDNDHAGYDGVSTFDFQMIIGENESSATPTPYYFYLELG